MFAILPSNTYKAAIFRTMATITYAFQFKETKSSMQLTKTDDTKQESLKNVCFNLRKHLGQQM